MLTFLLLITLTVPSALTVIGNSKGMSKEWGATIERINGRDASRRNMHGMLHKIDAASQNLKAQGKSKNIRKYIITNHEGRNFPRRKKQTSSGGRQSLSDTNGQSQHYYNSHSNNILQKKFRFTSNNAYINLKANPKCVGKAGKGGKRRKIGRLREANCSPQQLRPKKMWKVSMFTLNLSSRY